MSHSPTQQSQLQSLAYSTLNTYFSNHSHENLEIEILPPAFSSLESLILEDGANLGIPKKTLVLAFVHARHLFFSHKNSDLLPERQKAHDATRIMLLFDPEHLTAANFRKRNFGISCATGTAANDDHEQQFRLQGQLKDEAFIDALWDELGFMNSILKSPLHRQSKSPTLWSHRAWWLERAINVLPQAGYDMSRLFREEVEAVMKAGERHPKNYYAWLYARRVVGMGKAALGGNGWHAFLGQTADTVAAWCKAHPSDISGFSFLVWLLGRLDGEEGVGKRIAEDLFGYAMDMRLANESLWTFLRIVFRGRLMRGESKRTMLSSMQEYIRTAEKVDGEDAFLERVREARDWAVENKCLEVDDLKLTSERAEESNSK